MNVVFVDKLHIMGPGGGGGAGRENMPNLFTYGSYIANQGLIFFLGQENFKEKSIAGHLCSLWL